MNQIEDSSSRSSPKSTFILTHYQVVRASPFRFLGTVLAMYQMIASKDVLVEYS
jgi:hypothetical protein